MTLTYLSTPANPVALVLGVPGGGWVKCDTTGTITTPAGDFGKRGFVYAVVGYRTGVLYGEQVADIAAAGQQMQAKYPTLAGRFFTLAASAGGQLAPWAAQQLGAKGQVEWCAPSDLTVPMSGYSTGAKKATLGTSKPTQAQLKDASPAWNCLSVPTLLQHNREKNPATGQYDDTYGGVPTQQSITYDANLRAQGTSSTLVVYDGLAHVWAGAGKTKLDEIIATAGSWIQQRLA